MAQFDFAKVRDEVIANIGELVTETAKNELLGWFKNTALPYAEQVADAYTHTLKKQAETEHGWCKMRDGVVLPTLFAVVEFAVKKTLDILDAKAKAEDAEAAKKAEAPAEQPAVTETIAQIG